MSGPMGDNRSHRCGGRSTAVGLHLSSNTQLESPLGTKPPGAAPGRPPEAEVLWDNYTMELVLKLGL